MILALVVLTVAQLFDLGTFVRMVATHGPGVEANPLVRFVLVEFGLPTLAVAKIVALSLVVAVIAVLAGRSGQDGPSHGRLAAAVVGLAIAGGLIGGWSNAAVIL